MERGRLSLPVSLTHSAFIETLCGDLDDEIGSISCSHKALIGTIDNDPKMMSALIGAE